MTYRPDSLSVLFYIAAFLLLFTALYRDIRQNGINAAGNVPQRKSEIAESYLLVLLGSALVLRIVLVFSIEGFSVDVNTFKAWASTAAENLPAFYTQGMFADYPPFYVYILFLIGKFAAATGLQSVPQAYTLLVKLPSIAADLITAYLLFRLSRRHLNDSSGLIAAVIYAFNPAVLLNSTLWGQVDSFFTLLIVAALLLLSEGRIGTSSVLFTAAVLMKPQGIIFLPILFFELLKRRKILNFLWSIGSALAAGILILLPFSLKQHPLWIIGLFKKTAGEYPYASLNAFNLFALLGSNLKKDSSMLLFLNYNTWGLIFILLVTAFTGYLYLKGKISGLPFIGGAVMISGVFVLSSRMHERYLYPVLALLLLAFIYIKDKRLLYLFAAFTLTISLNTHSVLFRMISSGYPHVPANDGLLTIVSLINVLLFIYLTKIAIDILVKNKISVLPLDQPDIRKAEGGERTAASILQYVHQAESAVSRLMLDKKDILIMASMTLAYLFFALVNLGGLNSPKTCWKPVKQGESFIVDFGREASVSRIYYHCGLGNGKYRFEYESGPSGFQPLAAIEPNNHSDFYKWKYIAVAAKTQRIRVVVEAPGAAVHEIGFFEGESTTPLSGFKITGKNVKGGSTGIIENLFDEQKIIPYVPSYLNSTYFDEIYHARTAYEHLERVEPYESTHPPLGKILIALGIALFGMNPFGWRIAGTLFGAAMIPVMYMFGKKLFGKKFYAFCSAFLMMFDFMHFAQTRIATIDVYVTFFVILMFYFMYDYFVNKSYALGLKKSLKPLLLCGLFFGLGAASKWIAFYGAAGLALLFIAARYAEYRDYSLISSLPGEKPEWTKTFISRNMVGTFLYCILFFIVIPGIIYILSYIPFMMVPGPGHQLKDILPYQVHMYNYHKNLTATHSFSSTWWQWPIMYRPIWYYAGSDLPAGKASTIVSFGNPAVWWVGIPAIISAVATAFKKRDRKMAVVFTAIAAQYLPWAMIPRIAFIYHYFSIVPFVILSIVYVIKEMMENNKNAKYYVYAYLAVTAALFVWFYPALSGMIVDTGYIDNLKWFKSWIF